MHAQTFLVLPSHSTAERFHARWHNRTLPHGLATHNVCIRWAVPYKDRRNPTPEDSVAATAHVRVPGLGLLAEFVTTEEEEGALIALLDARPWDEASLKGRRSQHYGACAIDFRTRDIGGGGAVGVPPIPPACAALVERARALLLDGEGQGEKEGGGGI